MPLTLKLVCCHYFYLLHTLHRHPIRDSNTMAAFWKQCTDPRCSYFLYVAIFIAGVARIMWLLSFPVGQAPEFAEIPPSPKAWPSTGDVSACGTGDGSAFKKRSRFAVASLLSGAAEEYVTYAYKLGVSLGYFVDVDMILLLPNGASNHSTAAYAKLETVGWRKCFVPALGSQDQHYLYTKLAAWNLNYEAVLMIDLDTLVVGDISPLFDFFPALLRRTGALIAAVRDHPEHWSPRWTAAGDRFNAGVMLLLPDPGLYRWLVDGMSRIQYDDGMLEQAYLNAALRQRYMPLPLEYNAVIIIAYAEPMTWARVLDKIKIVHFTYPKPHRPQLCKEYNMVDICRLWVNS